MGAPQQTVVLDSIKITYLPDGDFFVSPADLYPHVAAEEWQAYTNLLGKDGRFVSNVGAHLIQTREHTILVDTGMGPRTVDFPESSTYLRGGELLQSLQQAGLTPADIDIVFYTHLHIDHVGWTGHAVAGSETLTFPRARHLVRQAEWEKFDKPRASRAGIEDTLRLLEPKIEFIEDGQELAPDVLVKATPGHTPGHAAVIVRSASEQLWLLGDSFHNAVGIEHPEWIDEFDEDPTAAAKTRQALAQELAHPYIQATGIHLWPSTFGRVVEQNGHVAWQPTA
jgi:glyoxylase-like metal-dependent hydrolase (beta-lactamase superfamily II)